MKNLSILSTPIIMLCHLMLQLCLLNASRDSLCHFPAWVVQVLDQSFHEEIPPNVQPTPHLGTTWGFFLVSYQLSPKKRDWHSPPKNFLSGSCRGQWGHPSTSFSLKQTSPNSSVTSNKSFFFFLIISFVAVVYFFLLSLKQIEDSRYNCFKLVLNHPRNIAVTVQ